MSKHPEFLSPPGRDTRGDRDVDRVFIELFAAEEMRAESFTIRSSIVEVVGLVCNTRFLTSSATLKRNLSRQIREMWGVAVEARD